MDEELWKQRFLMFTAARLTGVIVFVAGVFLAFTDLAQEGGMPLLGGIVAIIGAADAVFAPRMLKKVWNREDAAAGRPTDGPGRGR